MAANGFSSREVRRRTRSTSGFNMRRCERVVASRRSRLRFVPTIKRSRRDLQMTVCLIRVDGRHSRLRLRRRSRRPYARPRHGRRGRPYATVSCARRHSDHFVAAMITRERCSNYSPRGGTTLLSRPPATPGSSTTLPTLYEVRRQTPPSGQTASSINSSI